MKIGEMRERITLYSIITPQGPHQIFNPTAEDVVFYAEVWAKREDKLQSERWSIVTLNAVNRRQFIIRYRGDLPGDMALLFDKKLYTVLGRQDLDNKRRYTMLLAGRLNEDGDGIEIPQR